MDLLFDLDGTLTDSLPGIMRCINHALAELGRDPVPDARCRGAVESPLGTIFGSLLGSSDPELIDRAVAAYRARFDSIGMFENNVFPGVASALATFRRSGHTLQVVTAKPAPAARRVIAHFGLEHYFEAVHGPDPNERACSKADLVRAALQQTLADPMQAVMIRDRVDDILAARAHGLRSVAAGWGYGDPDELQAAAPDFIARTVPELVAWVQAAGQTA